MEADERRLGGIALEAIEKKVKKLREREERADRHAKSKNGDGRQKEKTG